MQIYYNKLYIQSTIKIVAPAYYTKAAEGTRPVHCELTQRSQAILVYMPTLLYERKIEVISI